MKSLSIAGFLLMVAGVLAEERLGVRQYPEYREYAARTRGMMPYIL